MTNLKRFVLVLAVPLLVMPQISKAVTFDASDLYLKPLVFNLESTANTSKDNYVISYSGAEVSNGVINFDNKTATFSVGIKDKSTADGMPRLQSVTYKLFDLKNSTTPVKTLKVTQTDRSGVYRYQIEPSQLDAQKDYRLLADLVFTSQVEGSIPVIINNPNVLALTLKHKVVENTPVFTENYVISSQAAQVGGTYKFNHGIYNTFNFIVKEKDASADTQINAVTLKIYNDVNQMVHNQTITGDYASFSLNFKNLGLAVDKNYKSYVDVKFVTGGNTNTRTYFAYDFVGLNDAQPSNPTPVFTENYVISSQAAQVGGTYKFNHGIYNTFNFIVKEKDASADTQISSITLKIYNDANKMVHNQTIGGDYASFLVNFKNLDLAVDKTYKSYVDVKFVTGTETGTRTYFAYDFVGLNDAQPSNPTPVFTENYVISSQAAQVGGTYKFNHGIYNTFNFIVKEKDASADTQISSITLKIYNDANKMVHNQTIAGDYASFLVNFKNLGLAVDKTYKSYVDVKFVTGTETGTRTYFAYDFVGLNDAQPSNPTPVFQENVKIVTDPSNSQFTFNYSSRYNITVSEAKNNIDTQIKDSTVRIVDKDSNAVVYTKTITGRSAYFQLNFDGQSVKIDRSYKVYMDVNYVTGNSISKNSYYVADLIGANYNKVSPTPEPGNPSGQVTALEINNLNYKVTAEKEYVVISASQKNPTVKNTMPRVDKIYFYANGALIQSCDADNCSFTYTLPAGQQTAVSVRADYVYDYQASNYSYYKTYDAGTYSRNAGSNDPTLLNQYILIKGSGPQVYLLNKAGHRYYIPAWSVLKSWYHTVPSIVQVNDAELPQYQLKGNVIYKPGSLIKIATDPKCYAVDKNGVLRWVINENVARSIYGKTWNKNIHIVPDSLFPSYSFGANIYSSADYSIPMLSEVVNMYNN